MRSTKLTRQSYRVTGMQFDVTELGNMTPDMTTSRIGTGPELIQAGPYAFFTGGGPQMRHATKISNAHIHEAVITRGAEQRRLVDDLLGLFGGRAAPLMSHLIESGQLTLKDVEEARKLLKKGDRNE